MDGEAGLPPFARLLADCGRFGFSRAVVLVPAAIQSRTIHLLSNVPGLPQYAVPEVVAVNATSVPAALHEASDRFDSHVLLLDPDVVLEANWLNLLPALTSHGHSLALTPGNGSFAFADGRVEPRLSPDAPGFVPAGAAIVFRDALIANGGCVDLLALFTRLAESGQMGGHVVPASAISPVAADIVPRPVRPALFLDRDGTLNEDYGYVSDPDRLVLLPGAAAAVKRANDLGWYVFLVTNQSGVGRGYYDETQVVLCNAALQDMLRAEGAHLDDIRYAPDHPDAANDRYRRVSHWRKPEPGMLIDLMAQWPVRREDSLMVGDKESDLGAGQAAGITSLLFSGGNLDVFLAPHLRAKD